MGVRQEGGFHNRYSEKFPEFHQGMLQVLDVPGFEYILIHIGNFETNTDGCLLVARDANTGGKISIPDSTEGYIKFYKEVIQAALDGELTIEYRDSDLHPITWR